MPFRDANPVWGILVVSGITGVLMLFIYKATSDQAGIKQAKNRVKGHFLAIRLYRDDIGVMFDTMKNIILSNLTYMRKSLRPMLFLSVPVGIVLVQLGSRYEFRPFVVGETIVLTLQLDEAREAVDFSKIALALPDGLELDMRPVRIADLREVNWRLMAKKSGTFQLRFSYKGTEATKTLQVVDSLVPVASARAQSNLAVSLMNPHEPTLGEGEFASIISIGYPKRPFEFLGMETHWLVAFFVFSLVAAFSLKGVLGVEV
ncbi:hypothetical protein MJD09_10560 [bacterium]|nr:hypothetical protein [bacterium]